MVASTSEECPASLFKVEMIRLPRVGGYMTLEVMPSVVHLLSMN
jgi:hypothetical protein